MENVRKVCDEFLKEIQSGKVETKENIYNIKVDINTSKTDEMIPVLKIKDKDVLFLKFKSYLKEVIKFRKSDENLTSDFIKNCLVHLFANATFTDFENPEMFIDKYIDFMNMEPLTIKTVSNIFDDVMSPKEMIYGSDLSCEIVKQSEFFETPYAFKSKISLEDLEYRLPVISFGISNNTCYIYAIQKEKYSYKTIENETYNKKVKRVLYKVDDKVINSESSEYLEYKEGKSDYYPENITDVVPSAVLALSLFLNILYQNNITNVSVVPYLPVRYNAKKEALENKARYEAKLNGLSEEQLKKMLEESSLEQLRIQNNLTQKLIRNFMRLHYHFNNVDIIGYPYEVSEYLNIKINPFVNTNNDVLKKIIESNYSKQK